MKLQDYLETRKKGNRTHLQFTIKKNKYKKKIIINNQVTITADVIREIDDKYIVEIFGWDLLFYYGYDLTLADAHVISRDMIREHFRCGFH